MFKTTRAYEVVNDQLFEGGIVPVLDEICPGWDKAIVHWIDGAQDRPDLVYEIGDVFVRGWDLTGAINRAKKKKKG